MERRATYIAQARGEQPDALLVDTGDALFGSTAPVEQQSDELVVRALGAMRYDALNAGAGELRLTSSPALRRLAEPGAPALVSSNGQPPSGAGDAVAPKPYLVREVGGVRVGIVGVTSPDDSGAASAARLQPAVEALRSILPEVRRQADLIVALADLSPDEAAALAGAGLDLQVVLGSRVIQSQELTWVGKTAVVAVGGEGRYVGRLTLQVDARGQIVSAKHEIGTLGREVPDDAAVASLRGEYQ